MVDTQNYKAYETGSITLPCLTTLNTGVKWDFNPNGPLRHVSSTIYDNGRIRKEFQSRFTVDKIFPGFYDLIISEVDLHDAGNYTCFEDNGMGKKHIRILDVQAIYITLQGNCMHFTVIYVLNLNQLLGLGR